VIRMPGGAGHQLAAQHSHSLEAWYSHVPGRKVACPATPYDAKGLLKTAIRDDDPVIFLVSEGLYAKKGPVGGEEDLVPFGRAAGRSTGEGEMAEFRKPKISDTMEEGTVLQWLRAEGDDVPKGEPIVEIESDKANMMVEQPDSGVLAIIAQEGETLPVGAPIA